MKSSHLTAAWFLVLLAGVLGGCSKAPPPPPPSDHPTTFAITATNIVIPATELRPEPSTRIVRADFNLDQLEDMAIEEMDSEGRAVVNIYLRRRSTDLLQEEYYKAGGIHQSGDYLITALMSSRDKDHVDLIVIFTYQNGSKDMVQFRSFGTHFEEIMRKHTPAPPGAGR